ncbi:hypothetical protein [Pseudomonas sp. KK4]|uniref:hypothetical protein n=1 Tax=Pseudomonas sp. KK4 TaxID=1855729 RepID=UPI0011158C42|nr:hypothetical protein [Pseudomonas sp. KK4]
MKISLYVLVVLLSSFARSSIATPWGMAASATTKASDGQLSICLPDKKLRGVTLHSVIVIENQRGKGHGLNMWKIELQKDAAPITLNQRDCILYGAQVPGYLESETAKPLEVGSVYYARVNVDVANATRVSILFYDVVFCVAPQRDGGVIYPQYKIDRNGRELDSPC